ncbi:hypothetical protein BACCAP_00208 [Pseudoflavonifractor capillosus ATCC 29799]|mgnify:CR=1 FL=1|uniref:Uncharacterized protein n=1 Tax=Pseudoflavonifractor capillosus ATCC 29799 TaxID=411467 RepID=A6NPU2_9FIRM|nr:hypothetical protein [Pseudoflavonifractor capillosus]EDN01867.1 hypothetical protein BACCAP_00208 [Pseudoflavonifractor capillosus ATCC 29799]
MNIKKQSAGVWVNLIAAILAVASLIVYGVNISSEGYFQNATVSSMINYGIPAIILLVLVIVLAQLKLTGGAAAAVEIISGAMRIAVPVLLTLCLINLISARAEGLGYIYFSNADVTLEVQTPENLSSATGTIANMICLAVSAVVAMAAAFFRLTKKEA